MKKLAILVGVIILLTSCSNENVEMHESVNLGIDDLAEFKISETVIEERDNFIKVMNALIDGVDNQPELIKVDEIEDVRKESDLYWQKIHSDGAQIEVKYNKDGGINGYHVAINTDLDDDTIYVVATVETLGLDMDRFIDVYEETVISKEELKTKEYEENNYTVTMIVSGDLEQHIFNFDKID